MWLKKHVWPTMQGIGIENVTFQIMRRSFYTDNLARDPKSIQAIMGHACLDMTANVYAESQESKIAELLASRWLRLGLDSTKGVQ